MGPSNLFPFGKPTPKQRWKAVFKKTQMTPRGEPLNLKSPFPTKLPLITFSSSSSVGHYASQRCSSLPRDRRPREPFTGLRVLPFHGKPAEDRDSHGLADDCQEIPDPSWERGAAHGHRGARSPERLHPQRPTLKRFPLILPFLLSVIVQDVFYFHGNDWMMIK